MCCITNYAPNREYYVGCVWCITTYDPNREYYVDCLWSVGSQNKVVGQSLVEGMRNRVR